MSQLSTWELDIERREKTSRLRELYELLAVQLFKQYEPTIVPAERISRNFLIRLEAWLDCFETDTQKWAAFRSIEYLLFIGVDEIYELYRAAHKMVIEPWLINETAIDIFALDAEQRLQNELNACWPCPVTDSFLVNQFLRITGIPGNPLRPDWHVLKAMGDSEKIKQYVDKFGITRLILLEDFSGSGGQISRALTFAANTFPGPILLVPLVVCSVGDEALKEAVASIGRDNIKYRPVLLLERDCLVREEPAEGEPPFFNDLRLAISNGYGKIGKDLMGGAYGYGGVGSLVIMKSNCPNNTPPIFHYDGNGWNPPFPRHDRFRENHGKI